MTPAPLHALDPLPLLTAIERAQGARLAASALASLAPDERVNP